MPIDIGNFLANVAPPLQCDGPMYRDLPPVPPYRSIFNRRP
jgi:hypothetical protein